MAVKDVYIYNVIDFGVGVTQLIFTLNVDAVAFHPGGVEFFTEATDTRVSYEWGHPNVHRVIVCPAGIAYIGDAVASDGPKKVTVQVQGGVQGNFDYVDDVDFSTGWVVITKGAFVAAYKPSILDTVKVEPH